MTSVKDQLRADLNVNLKAHNVAETLTLRNVLGAIQSAEKSGKTAVEYNDEQVLALIASEVKKRRGTAEEMLRAVDLGRPDGAEKAAKETAEADFLAKYLPQVLTNTEIEKIVDDAIATLDAPNFGLVMKTVTSQTKGRADGRVVSELVKAKLG